MNVTLRLPDDLCKKARHAAVDQSKSLSAWMVELLRRELEPEPSEEKHSPTLAEAMNPETMPDWFYEKDFPLEDRKAGKIREMNFED